MIKYYIHIVFLGGGGGVKALALGDTKICSFEISFEKIFSNLPSYISITYFFS